MNELTEGTFVTAVRVGGIEVHLALAADGTQAVFIERIRIDKRSAAGTAKEVGLQRLRE